MLYADKRALESNLEVSLIKIREKELTFYTKNCSSIGTQAALLAGFAYSGIIGLDLTDVSRPMQVTYAVVTTFAMTFELIALLNSMMCSMLGPGLALRGPEGSMHRAVDGLTVEYRVCFLFFVVGVLAFFLSAVLFACSSFRWPLALLVSGLLLLFGFRIVRSGRRIYLKFQLKAEHMQDGRLDEQENDLRPGEFAERRPDAARAIANMASRR